jgi:hypothetical protein
MSAQLARSFVDMLSAEHEKVCDNACQSLDIQHPELESHICPDFR